MTGPCVLVVDDDADVRFTVKATLEPEFSVREAANGEEAVSAALKLKPAIILLDVSMPGMGGIWALRKLHAALPATRVVMLTGEKDIEIAAKALKSGAAAYVTKPFDVDQLRAEARGHRKTQDDEDKPWRVEP